MCKFVSSSELKECLNFIVEVSILRDEDTYRQQGKYIVVIQMYGLNS